MGKNIVIITGSPREGGNSDLLAEAFLQAAEQKGHSICRFNAGRMKLDGCHACETCYSTGKPCTYDDDFNQIAPAVLAADVVVFSMPTYWFSIPSNIKAVLDRMYCFLPGGKSEALAGKQAILMVCCADDASAMEGVVIPFQKTFEMLEWDLIGEVLVPEVSAAGDIIYTNGCQQAAALAEKL